MSWKMSCPKCGSLNLDLERDRRVAGIRGPHQVQLHCYTCGFVLYGEKSVQEECDKQYAVWLAARQHDPKPEPIRRAPVQDKPAAAAAPVAAQAPENSVSPPPPAAAADKPEAEPVAPAGDFRPCNWPGCGKPARPRSKYCSRNCSNKNARSRHAQRKT